MCNKEQASSVLVISGKNRGGSDPPGPESILFLAIPFLGLIWRGNWSLRVPAFLLLPDYLNLDIMALEELSSNARCPTLET